MIWFSFIDLLVIPPPSRDFLVKTQVQKDQNSFPNGKAGLEQTRGKENYSENALLRKAAQDAAPCLLTAGEEKRNHCRRWRSPCLRVRKPFRSEPPNACILLTTGRNLLQEGVLCIRLFKKAKKKNHPRVAFLVDEETLGLWLCLYPPFHLRAWATSPSRRIGICGLPLTCVAV